MGQGKLIYSVQRDCWLRHLGSICKCPNGNHCGTDIHEIMPANLWSGLWLWSCCKGILRLGECAALDSEGQHRSGSGTVCRVSVYSVYRVRMQAPADLRVGNHHALLQVGCLPRSVSLPLVLHTSARPTPGTGMQSFNAPHENLPEVNQCSVCHSWSYSLTPLRSDSQQCTATHRPTILWPGTRHLIPQFKLTVAGENVVQSRQRLPCWTASVRQITSTSPLPHTPFSKGGRQSLIRTFNEAKDI